MAIRILAVLAMLLSGCTSEVPEHALNTPESVPVFGNTEERSNSTDTAAILPGPPAHCELQIELPTEAVVSEGVTAVIRITNRGDNNITLVDPGSGDSLSHWRTPCVTWSWLSVASEETHSAAPLQLPRCGNIDPLRPDEVFVLKPGASKVFTQTAPNIRQMEPGTYRVAYFYANIPDFDWQGVPLGPHDEEAMRRVKASNPVLLVSNEVTITLH